MLEFDSNIIDFPKNSTVDPALIDSNSVGPIEQKMRSTINRLKNCKYPDTFDWSMYDKLADSFPERPRGGVVFNTTLKLLNHHSTCAKCHYSFEVDSYGRGCFHNCTYCYAMDQLNSHGFWNRPQPFPVNLAEIRKIFYTVFETDKPSKWREIMAKRTPIRVGSMSDSFMYIDKRYGVTKELLKIFKFYQYPYVIFTRSDLVAHDGYIELLDKDLCAVQFSIAGNNARLTRLIEPGAPSYKRRLNALSTLADANIWTTVRINPLFAKHPDGWYTDPDSIKERFGSRKNAPVFDLYDENFIPELAEAKVPSVLAGFVRLSGSSVNRMSKASGIDIRSFFKPEFLSLKGDNRYSDAEIGYYYKMFRKWCDQDQIRFSTCYIGNGIKDYFQYQGMWSNKSKDCCDVIGNVKKFKGSSQDISWDIRKKHAPCKETAEKVRLDDISTTQEFESTGAVDSKLAIDPTLPAGQ